MEHLRDNPSNIQSKADAVAEPALSQENSASQNDSFAKLSHEIRTPLNAVIGVADALIHHHGDENINPKLELIQTAAANILKILDKTLIHAKMEADKIALESLPTDIRKTVKSICALWEHKAAQNSTNLYCHIDNNVPQNIKIDGFRYEQCLNNLLSNAIKFTQGGTVEVVVTLDGAAEGEPKLILGVSDTGIGITKEQQERIFDAYTQADTSIESRFGGTGLGLNIVKHITEAMGGEIAVQSCLNKGSMFTISVPVTCLDDDMTVEPNFEKIAEETPLTNLKVLVVDDNAANHFVIQALLENEIGGIVTAKDGASAIRALTVYNFDLVLMDIHMPEMDGFQTTQAIRASQTPWANVPIIGISADPQFHGEHCGNEVGMEGVVEKPVRYENLVSGIRRALTPRSNVIDLKRTA